MVPASEIQHNAAGGQAVRKLPIIPVETLVNICRVGQGAACCRYIVSGGNGIECVKHEPNLNQQINERVREGLFIAQGDNCEGLPLGELMQ